MGRAWYGESPPMWQGTGGKPSLVRMEMRSARRSAVLPLTGGCLNLSAAVFRTERETQTHLPSYLMDRIAVSDLVSLVRRGHSTRQGS
jgi:hypothetical protein